MLLWQHPSELLLFSLHGGPLKCSQWAASGKMLWQAFLPLYKKPDCFPYGRSVCPWVCSRLSRRPFLPCTRSWNPGHICNSTMTRWWHYRLTVLSLRHVSQAEKHTAFISSSFVAFWWDNWIETPAYWMVSSLLVLWVMFRNQLLFIRVPGLTVKGQNAVLPCKPCNCVGAHRSCLPFQR